MDAEQQDWILLIYSLPSQPTRKRAYLWRELKKLGAIYLRDGVALLPNRSDLADRLRSMEAKVIELGGTADLLLSPELGLSRSRELVERFQRERTEEYQELHHACIRFLRDVLDEVHEDDFGFPGVDKLDSELARLQRWHQQIERRDYFGCPVRDRVIEVLAKCVRSFEHFSSVAEDRDGSSSSAPPEDAFQRLGGAGSAHEDVSDELPL